MRGGAGRPKTGPTGREVLVRIRYVGICGSDIHLFNGTYNGPHSYPMRFGHEWSGVVEAVGSEVTRVEVGDVVTGDCSRYCGACPSCEVDKNLCQHIEKFGITVDGASADYILRDEMYLYRAPEGLDIKHLCLSEPVAVAAHPVEKVRKAVPSGFADKRVLVLGGGVIGMSALMLLLHMENCRQAELYDLAESRTALARAAKARVSPQHRSLRPAARAAITLPVCCGEIRCGDRNDGSRAGISQRAQPGKSRAVCWAASE